LFRKNGIQPDYCGQDIFAKNIQKMLRRLSITILGRKWMNMLPFILYKHSAIHLNVRKRIVALEKVGMKKNTRDFQLGNKVNISYILSTEPNRI